mmetsp:Transcript_52213/g.146529  ORF Transcript_52213/g.146529 Transcript_52213/m.146529 type:complete len:175 (-) Transcript_52213:284-808(-)
MFHEIRVPPDTRYTAEVVVLLTTLGAKRTEYNAGKRAKDLLEIKRVHFKPVDFNRLAREGAAENGEAENVAIQKLLNEGKLQTSGESGDVVLPQIFIDGQYIGGAEALQDMEDDGKLDEVLERRDPNWRIDEILPGMMTIEQCLREYAMYTGYGSDGEYDSDEDEYVEGSVNPT